MQDSVETVERTVGLRERKKLARRELLIDVTHRLVAERGLDAVTVEQISADAGVSTRTFFNYFDSKIDAVLGIGAWDLDPEVADVFAAGGPTGDLAADLRVLIESLLDRPGIGKDRIAAAFELARREPRILVRHLAWMEEHRGVIEALVTRRFGDRHERRADLVGMVLMLTAHVTFFRWEAGGSTGEVRDLLPAVLDDLRSLLSPP